MCVFIHSDLHRHHTGHSVTLSTPILPLLCSMSHPPVSASIPPSSLVTSLLSSLFSLAFVTRDVTGACDGAPVACDKACATKARERLSRIPTVTWWWTSERLGWHDAASRDCRLTAHFCPILAVPAGSRSPARVCEDNSWPQAYPG